MPTLQIILDGDGCWPDLTEVQIELGELEGVALLPDGDVTDGFTGLTKKVPVVLLRVRSTETGNVVIAQAKLNMLETAVRALRGHIDFLEEQRASAKGDA
jgi:hypothetical protein